MQNPPKTGRKKLHALHAWVGFHFAALVFIVLLTGSIGTISHEVDWLLQHDMRVEPDGTKVSWGKMYSAVKTHRPNSAVVALFHMGADYFAYRARVIDEYGRHRFVHVNQWTGEVTGETHPLTVQRVFRDLHRYLFMPNFIGLPIVTSIVFILALSLYTGLKMSRDWRCALFQVRTRRGARVLIGDVHKSAGLWSIWFFVVIIVTGLWYLIEFGVAVSGNSVQAPRYQLEAGRAAELGWVTPEFNVDGIIHTAQKSIPNWEPRVIYFPRQATAAIEVHGVIGNPLIRPRANRIFLDPEDLSVVYVQKSSEIHWSHYINEMADPLHFGYFGKLPTKIIWFVFGMIMSGLSATGVWLTWKRLKVTAPSKTQYATLPVLIVSMYFCTHWYARLQGPEVPKKEIDLGFQDVLPQVKAKALISANDNGEPTGGLRLVLQSIGGRPNLASVQLTVDGVDFEEKPSRLAELTEIRFNLSVNAFASRKTILTSLEFTNGERVNATWQWFNE